MARFSSGSVFSLVSVFTVFALVGACDSDESNPGGPDAAADSSSGRGGRGGSGGSGGGSGGSGGAPDVNVCNMPVAVVCDGPEDCPTGQRCCGKWEQQYVEFGCFASCVEQQGDADPSGGMGALWFDLCHADDTCEVEGAQCLTSQYLPDSLSRCYTDGTPPDAALGRGAKEINCGDDVCTSTEKCCLRGTFEPYCTPTATPCECDPSPPDAGGDAGDAAPDAAGDASPEAGDASPDVRDSGRDAPTG